MHLVTTAVGKDGTRNVLASAELASVPGKGDVLMVSLPKTRAGEEAWLVSLHERMPDAYQMEHGQYPNSQAFRKFCAAKGWDERKDGSAWKWAHLNLVVVPKTIVLAVETVVPLGTGVLSYQEFGKRTTIHGRAELRIPAGFVQVGQVHDEVLLARTGDAACQRELDARALRIGQLEEDVKALRGRVQDLDTSLGTAQTRAQKFSEEADAAKKAQSNLQIRLNELGQEMHRQRQETSHWRNYAESIRPRSIVDHCTGPDRSIVDMVARFQADMLARSTTPIMMQFPDEDGAKQFMDRLRLAGRLATAEHELGLVKTELKEVKRLVVQIREAAGLTVGDGVSLVKHIQDLTARAQSFEDIKNKARLTMCEALGVDPLLGSLMGVDLAATAAKLRKDLAYADEHRVSIWTALGRVFDSEKCDPTWAQVREEARNLRGKATSETKLAAEWKRKHDVLYAFFDKMPKQMIEPLLDDFAHSHLEEVKIDESKGQSWAHMGGPTLRGNRTWTLAFRA